LNKYLKEYEWSNIAAMIRNGKAEPRETQEGCDGKLAVITGATSGIGYETARLFASRGARLLCVNRSRAKSDRLTAEIEREFGVPCRCIVADFSRLSDIREAAAALAGIPESIDILVHNAGVYNTKRIITADGLEEVFQVDYLASFIITCALIEKLRREGRARVILVNSEGHRFAIEGLRLDDLDWKKRHYAGLRSYGSAKTAQLLAMSCFDERFRGSGVSINAMHPGDVRTAMGENNGRIYRFIKRLLVNPSARAPGLSAKAIYYLAASRELSGVSGKYFSFTTEEAPAPHALDSDLAAELWETSLRLGGLS
jgi:retinol dehydrogenase 13